MEAAKAFYTSAFGRALTDYGPEYTGIQGDGSNEQGGLPLDSAVQTGRPLVIALRGSRGDARRGHRGRGTIASRLSPCEAAAVHFRSRPATSPGSVLSALTSGSGPI